MKLWKVLGILSAVLMIFSAGANLATAQEPCPPAVWELYAGQTTDVGSVTVSNDNTNIFVTYALDTANYPSATFGMLQVWVGTNLTLMPQAANGQPIPGQFPYKHDASGLTTYQFVIPIADLNLTGDPCGTSFYVVTHAEVDGVSEGTETAFGGCTGVNIAEPGRWWYYCTYTICCPNGGGNGDGGCCETAFSYGCYVFATNPKANPDGLPTVGLTNNKWGWVVRVEQPMSGTENFWAAAGLNDTSKGVLVGQVQITWDGSVVHVCINMNAGFVLKEGHLYAGDFMPTTIAPGQYGNPAYFYPEGTISHCWDVAVSDTNGDGIWLIIHGVVCN